MFAHQRSITNKATASDALTLDGVLEEIKKTDMEFTLRVINESYVVVQVFGPNKVLEFEFEGVA